MDSPIVSIIIPTFNRAHLIGETLESVLSQTYTNWECIVVDDGSTDNSQEVVNSINDPRIKYFYKQNEERSIARNFGITRAKGQYICFLDSDDIYYPNHLAVLLEKIRKENYPIAIFYTGINEKRGDRLIRRPFFNSQEYDHPFYFVWEKFMLPSSVCVHRDILKMNNFPPKFNVWEDTHLWLRVVAQYPFFQIEEVTTQWNIHEGGTVEKAFGKVKAAHVMKYLNCIYDLQNNYRKLLQPYITDKDFKIYRFKKLKMFLHIVFNRNQFNTFTRLYVYGISKVDRRKTNQFVKSLFMTRARQKIHDLRNQ